MKYLEEAVKEAEIGLIEELGGPFGAIIVNEGKIISRGCNRVLKDNDPTAHAEVIAIRRACKILKTYDLSNCEIYTTSEPCPMCLAAIMWAGITTIYYGTDRKAVAEVGFRDDYI